MEVKITPEIQSLFAEYERLVQGSDYRSLAKLYGSKIVAAGPKGVAFHSNNIITRWRFDKSMREFYEKVQRTSIRILRMHEYKISEQYSQVRTTWIATFSKTHSQAFEFHVTYIVRKRKNKGEIVMFIAHEDETRILEGYSILP